MKFLLAVGLLVACQSESLALELSDLHTPTRKELDRLNEKLKPVNAADAALRKAEIEIKRIKGDISIAKAAGRTTLVRELEADLEEETRAADAALAKKNSAGDAAIALAIATALAPREWPNGITHNPLYPSQWTRWRILARENEDFPALDLDGKPVVFPKAKPNKYGRLPMAQTLPNQVSVIHAKAFASAEELVLTVVHEMDHYDLARDPKYPKKFGPEDEVECYDLELSYLEFLPWGDRPKDKVRKEGYRTAIEVVRAQKKQESDTLKATPGATPGLPPMERRPDVTDVDLTPIIERSREIEKAVREHTEVRYLGYVRAFANRVCTELPPPFPAEYGMVLLHPDRSIYWRKADAMHRKRLVKTKCDEIYAQFLVNLGTGGQLSPPPRNATAEPPSYDPGPTAPRVPDPPNVWAPKPRVPPGGESDLSDLVANACANPGGFQSAADFSWFPAPGYPFAFGPRDPQDYCQRSLWDYLMTLNAQGGKLDMQDVSHRAWGYQPRSPSIPPSVPDCPRRVGDRCVPDLGN